jgi:hypothetical protein
MYINNYKKLVKKWRQNDRLKFLEKTALISLVISIMVSGSFLGLNTFWKQNRAIKHTQETEITQSEPQNNIVYLYCNESVKNKRIICIN